VAAARRTGAGKLAISVADQGPGLRFEQVAGANRPATWTAVLAGGRVVSTTTSLPWPVTTWL